MSNITYTCNKTDCFHCYELDRLKKPRPYTKVNWTEWELNYLEANYKDMKTEQLSDFLNRSPTSIWQKVHDLRKIGA